MESRSILRVGLLTAACAGMLLAGAGPASAHARREVGGKYRFVVGWGEEPAYAGFRNSVQIRLSDLADQPVTDLGDTLKVEVSIGGQKKVMALEPNFRVGAFGTPGDYRAWIVPTRPGTYTFRFTGTIRGDGIEESFTSGPDTFDSIVDVSEIQFPARDPGTGQLAQRLDREAQRLERQASQVSRDVSTARLLAIAGIVIGVVALAGSVLGRRAAKG